MADLTTEQKTFIVKHLAWGDTPTEVADAVKETFDIVVSRQAVHAYDPTKGKPRAKWLTLYKKERTKAKKAIDEIPTTHLAVRVRKLDRMASKAEGMRNYALAAQLLEQIAKDQGGVFTNRQKLEHTGKDGKPLPAAQTTFKMIMVRPSAGGG